MTGFNFSYPQIKCGFHKEKRSKKETYGDDDYMFLYLQKQI